MIRPSFRHTVLAASLIALGACSSGGSESELLASGKALLAKRDAAGAVLQFKSALDKNAGSSETRLLLGRALLMAGNASEALIELQKAQASNVPAEQVVPDIARAHLALGESDKVIGQFGSQNLTDPAALADLKSSLSAAWADKGQPDEARVSAQEALKAKAGFLPAMLMLARLDVAAGDTTSAQRQLDGILASEPGQESAALMKAELLQRSTSDSEAALQLLRKVREVNPGSALVHAAIIDILLRQKKVDAARTELQALKKASPSHAETLNLQALFALMDKDHKTCRELTERLLVKRPENVPLLLLAGANELGAQQYTLAAGLLGRAVKVAPGDPRPRQLLARTFLRSGQPDKALEVLKPLTDGAQADAISLGLAGEALLQNGDSKRAEALFQRALKTAPQDASLRTSLALAQIARGDAGAATAQLEAIAKGDAGIQGDLALLTTRLQQRDLKGTLAALDELERKLPKDPFPPAVRGLVQHLQGDKAGATASLEKALKLQPGYFPAVARLAAIDLAAGQRDKARQRFTELVQADPKNTRARLALVDLDAQSGAAESTIVTQLREATKADAADPAPHLVLIDRLLSAGQAQDALAAAQEATAALPDEVNVMQALGRAQIAAGDSQRAVNTFKRMASLQPRNPQALVLLAEAFMAGNDRAQAEKAMRQALELQPEHVPAQRGLALLAAMDNRPQDAVGIARGMQKRSPKNAAGFALEGEIEAQRKNWGAAAAAFKSALQRDRSTALAILLHRSLVAGAQTAEADRLVAEWRKERPDDAGFVYHLGEEALHAKDWARAEARFRDVVALQPRNAAAVNNVAWLMVAQRKAGAADMARKAVELGPQQSAAHDTLSMALEADQQLPKALEAQQRAVELAPKNPDLRLRLAKLLIQQGKKSDAQAELDSLGRLGQAYGGHAEVQELLKKL